MNRTALNFKTNKKLHAMFWDAGITSCEIKLPGCLNTWMLNYCHRHPRRWYYDKPDELLWDKKQVVLGCQKCHKTVDDIMTKKEREEVFLKIRGEESNESRE
jgi:5-methylcytosine-specific restriction endonuclease McrA